MRVCALPERLFARINSVKFSPVSRRPVRDYLQDVVVEIVSIWTWRWGEYKYEHSSLSVSYPGRYRYRGKKFGGWWLCICQAVVWTPTERLRPDRALGILLGNQRKKETDLFWFQTRATPLFCKKVSQIRWARGKFVILMRGPENFSCLLEISRKFLKNHKIFGEFMKSWLAVRKIDKKIENFRNFYDFFGIFFGFLEGFRKFQKACDFSDKFLSNFLHFFRDFSGFFPDSSGWPRISLKK